MLAKEKSKHDSRLQPLINSMTWDKYDKKYIEETFALIKNYHDRVMKAQANVDKIIESVNSWGEIPLFARKDNETDTLLDIGNRDTSIGIRLRRCLVSNRLAERIVLDENYRLYFNVPPSCPCSSGSESSTEEEEEENEEFGKGKTASQRQQTMMDSMGDLTRLREPYVATVEIAEDNAALYTPYQEYVDELVGKAIMAGVHTRFVILI